MLRRTKAVIYVVFNLILDNLHSKCNGNEIFKKKNWIGGTIIRFVQDFSGRDIFTEKLKYGFITENFTSFYTVVIMSKINNLNINLEGLNLLTDQIC